jgi:SpoVK/Ycf46/Vps4 family AAA+-type ATPase
MVIMFSALLKRYTGADLGALVREAAIRALEEDISSEKVGMRHFRAALASVPPSPPPSAAQVQMYTAFQQGVQ